MFCKFVAVDFFFLFLFLILFAFSFFFLTPHRAAIKLWWRLLQLEVCSVHSLVGLAVFSVMNVLNWMVTEEV